ncbi:MAG: hypothetical protein MUO94_02500 [Thermoplasmata archaeon]|nr:hypothetical protein [Thermoplasmata archaeon]
MMRKEMSRIVEDSTRKLLQIAIPPVRRWALVYLMEKGDEDAVLQRTIEECETYPPRVSLLSSLRDDGTWAIAPQRKAKEDAGPGPPYGWTYITVLRNLYMLYQYGLRRGDDDRSEPCLDRLKDWQQEDGHMPGPELDMLPRPHYNGFALGVFLRYDMAGESTTDRLTRWLSDRQRPDGGWLIPYIEDMKYRPEYRLMRMADFIDLHQRGDLPEHDPNDYLDIPSCSWTTLGAIRGLIWHDERAIDPETRRGAEFVLNRFFKKNYHSTFNRSERNWTMLKFPPHHGNGMAAALCLAYFGFGLGDERMEKVVRWLLSERRADGVWHRSERPHPIDDQWITITSLMTLDYILKNS